MIDVNVDMGPFMEATGVIEGVAATVETDAYVNYVVDSAANQLRQKFDNDFLAAALSNPRAYHHVFEWGSIGYHGILQDSGIDVPVPLYALTKQGRGRNKTVGFRFKQSRIHVPLPDPERSGIPEENISRLKNRYVFRFKAYVMESGMTVHVTPRRARALFVPTPGAEKGFVFSRGYSVMPGKGNAGQFTGFWKAWWDGPAQAYMEDKVVPEVERYLGTIIERNLGTIRRGRYSKSKAFKVQSAAALQAMANEKSKMVSNQIMREAREEAIEYEEWDDEE